MIPSWLDLSGRVALVTGAGSEHGIGMAAARALADLGASVALTSTTERIHERAAELLTAAGFIADLTDDAQGARLVHEVVERFGGLHILVNNAGMASVGSEPESGDIASMTVERWRAGIARNLDSAFITTKYALPHLRKAGWGRIVNVASITGPVMAMRAEPAYAAAKAGMVGLTKALALDTAGSGVTVNAVAPGWIATASQTEAENPQGLATPMNRSGRPDEIGAAIAWLCTPGASYLTGQCIAIDGANSIAEERGGQGPR